MNNTEAVTNKDYLADNAPEWRYPLLDGEPPKGKKLNLLTSGGVAVMGQWSDNSNYIAWAPLIKASKIKEHMVRLLHNFEGSNTRKALLQSIFRYHAKAPLAGVEHLYNVVSAFLANYWNTQEFECSPTYSYQVKLMGKTDKENVSITFTQTPEHTVKVYIWKPYVNFVFHVRQDDFHPNYLATLISTVLQASEVPCHLDNMEYEVRGTQVYTYEKSGSPARGPLLVSLEFGSNILGVQGLEQ